MLRVRRGVLLIALHGLNSAWWGAPVGLITDPAFVDLPLQEQRRLLSTYEWVEFRGQHSSHASLRLHVAGFLHVETYCRCRVPLNRIEETPSVAQLVATDAATQPFALAAGDFVPFAHERWSLLPGVTQQSIDERYATYLNQVIGEQPGTSLAIASPEGAEGWFVAEPRSRETVQLSLAALSASATVAGAHLYRRALIEYARRGFRIGLAAFSARHAGVMNLYAKFGAVFTSPEEIWIWMSDAVASQSAMQRR